MAIRWLIELDGVVLDARPVHWEAYGRAAGEVDSARLPRPEFERLLRVDTPLDRLVRYARPTAAARFAERFTHWREDDACWETVTVTEATITALKALGRPTDRVAVTAGRNRAMRQAVLERSAATALFMEMQGLSDDPRRRAAELTALVGDAGPAVVVAGTVAVARSGHSAGLPVVGVPNALATPRRLTQNGCAEVITDLGALAAERTTATGLLHRLGIPPNAWPA